jgi:hypothetical protein
VEVEAEPEVENGFVNWAWPRAGAGRGRPGLHPAHRRAAKAIPLAMGEGADASGFIDLMVSSQTGSGKTAAFLLPVLHTLIQQRAEADAEAKAEFERLCAEATARASPLPSAPSARTRPTPQLQGCRARRPGAVPHA